MSYFVEGTVDVREVQPFAASVKKLQHYL